MKQQFEKSLESIKLLLKTKLKSDDLINQQLHRDNQCVEIIYIKSICDSQTIDLKIMKPFFEINSIEAYEMYIRSLPENKSYQSEQVAINNLLRGHVAIFTPTKCIFIDVKKIVNNNIFETTVESTLQGPKNALSEDLATNLNLIRHRYHLQSLTVELKAVSQTNLQLALLFDKSKVDSELLAKVQKKLASIDKQKIESSAQLQRYLNNQKRRLFPTIMITERPDRISFNLLKGKIAVLIEGSQFALIIPSVFFDFMSSMDDKYQSYWVTKSLVILRYTGLFISTFLPGLYVAFSAFNPEVLRVQLTLSISGSRMSVPFPAYLEVLFMLLMMEMLVEASIRLPKSIGSTATTVGGLILGQAATQAGLVSNIMIIIVAAVAISNFVVPINEMGFSFRVVKYVLLLISTLFGLIGIIFGFVALLIYLVHLESFGQPYLKLFIQDTTDKNL
ncbi:spore germination protein [Caldibacillus lycopersici]|uniref:Spore germination protein n=1 Tax=Perspicuibacillus lycopersici TaxID=1325689 RepID=A0AAE3IU79_9BACI|nr:spore germination protein [Perspicuibacillus lycopersici]MCU9613521.1 spore germination protein [Perspicuibacillus lycopersici]